VDFLATAVIGGGVVPAGRVVYNTNGCARKSLGMYDASSVEIPTQQVLLVT